jgi:hypothetical protein
VVTVEAKAVRGEQFLAQRVKVGGRYFKCRMTVLAGQVAVDGAGQVVDGRVLAEVGVYDNVEFFKLLQDSIHRRGADVGQALLDRERDFIGREVLWGTR